MKEKRPNNIHIFKVQSWFFSLRQQLRKQKLSAEAFDRIAWASSVDGDRTVDVQISIFWRLVLKKMESFQAAPSADDNYDISSEAPEQMDRSFGQQ